MPSPTTTETPPIAAPIPGVETPLTFESGDRPIYAVHHPGLAPRRNAPVLVICHSLGVEQLTCYRNEVLAARAVAELGIPVFRYHARGHGDSGGDFADVTVERLIEDATAAAAEARRRSGCTRTAWLGIRFGALAAAGAIAAGESAVALALWEPVERPSDYFRAMLRGKLYSEVAHGQRPRAGADELMTEIEREGQVDVHGYYLHRALVSSAADRDLERMLGGWTGPTLLVQVQARQRLAPAHGALVSALEQRGATVRTVQVAEEPGWHFISNPAWVSDPLVQETARWLDAVA